MQRFVPSSPTTCEMRYEVYRNKSSSDEDFDRINQIYKRVMSEDKYLCIEAQKNINTGVFVNGELHPKMEKGPLFFQAAVRDIVQAHHKREELVGQEIWPARQTLPGKAQVSREDEDFAAKVARTSQANKTESCDSMAREADGCCGGICQTPNAALAY